MNGESSQMRIVGISAAPSMMSTIGPSVIGTAYTDYDANGVAGPANVHAYGSVFKNTHVFEVGGLCVAGDYAELAKRFVGFVPEGRPGQQLGVSPTDRHMLPDVPTCPLPQEEVEELLKMRLRHCSEWCSL